MVILFSGKIEVFVGGMPFRHFGTTSRRCRTPPKNYFVIFKRRVAALIGSIVPTKILAESQEESFPYSRCKDTMQKMLKTAIMKKRSIFFAKCG